MSLRSRENAIHNILPYVDPFATEEDLEQVIWISDNEVYFKFKDGRRQLYDVALHGSMGFYPEGYELTDDELKRSFKDRLYRLMVHKGVTQEELAARTNTSQVMISRYMTGRCIPSFVMALKLARALGCSVEDLSYKEY